MIQLIVQRICWKREKTGDDVKSASSDYEKSEVKYESWLLNITSYLPSMTSPLDTGFANTLDHYPPVDRKEEFK